MSLEITAQEVEAQRKALNEIRVLLGKPEQPPFQYHNTKTNQEDNYRQTADEELIELMWGN